MYYDIRGKEVKLVPAADEEFITKPQIEVPVDLEVEKWFLFLPILKNCFDFA